MHGLRLVAHLSPSMVMRNPVSDCRVADAGIALRRAELIVSLGKSRFIVSDQCGTSLPYLD